MLVVDPEKRISWDDLFTHPIFSIREKKFFASLKNQLGDDVTSRVFGYFKQHKKLKEIHIPKNKTLLKKFDTNKNLTKEETWLDSAHQNVQSRIFCERDYYVYFMEAVEYLVKLGDELYLDLAKFILKRIVSHFIDLRKQLQTQLLWKD